MIYKLLTFPLRHSLTLLEYPQNTQSCVSTDTFVYLWYFATFGHIKIITLNTLKILLLRRCICQGRRLEYILLNKLVAWFVTLNYLYGCLFVFLYWCQIRVTQTVKLSPSLTANSWILFYSLLVCRVMYVQTQCWASGLTHVLESGLYLRVECREKVFCSCFWTLVRAASCLKAAFDEVSRAISWERIGGGENGSVSRFLWCCCDLVHSSRASRLG